MLVTGERYIGLALFSLCDVELGLILLASANLIELARRADPERGARNDGPRRETSGLRAAVTYTERGVEVKLITAPDQNA